MVAAGAAAKARIPARVVPTPNVYMRVPPDSLIKSLGHSCIFTAGRVPATLEDPADSEAVLSVLVLALQGCAAQRPAVQKYVDPPRKQAEPELSSFSCGENIRESQ